MTHEKALEAAKAAADDFATVDADDGAWLPSIEHAIAAYLAAYGVKDLGALVDAARGAMFDLRAVGHEVVPVAIRDALTPPSAASRE